MRDEAEYRRPDFVAGAAVKLADGQYWSLRQPRVRFVPDDSNDVGYELCLTLKPGDGFNALLARREALWDKDQQPRIGALAAVELAIGAACLRGNYALDADQVRELLQFSYDDERDPEGAAIRAAVMAAAFGRDSPKPSADGDDSSRSLSAVSDGATECS